MTSLRLGPSSFGKRGRTGGHDINKLGLERFLSEPRTGEMGTWLGGWQRYKRSCHSTFIGPSGQGHSDLDLFCKFIYPSKSGHLRFRPRSFVPAISPGRSFS